ncbi:MAG: MarR family transcriptional regulator [Gallionella sp.]|nr:MarR family transcriptional regulator [Gallionella sp.]MDD4960015.1 MarR family transcriptional regulator [Gallionella sp.]
MPDTSPFKHAKADDSAGFLLWKITALWQRKLSEVLGEFGITQTQYAILASLRWFEEQGEATTQAHVVEHAKIDKMTLSKAIRKLEEDDLVSRSPSSTDNRAINVKFTAKGKKVIQQAVVAIEKADDEFFACLTEQQLETYKSLTISVISSNG